MASQEVKTVLVTGANKGIGFEIVKQLLEIKNHTKYHVLLGSRDEKRGKEALQKLSTSSDSNTVELVQLDVTSEDSINQFVNHLNQNKKKIDILVNNAGWASKGSTINREIANTTLGVNYWGVKRLTNALLDHHLITSRIVIVSSQISILNNGNELRIQPFKNPIEELNFEKVDELVSEFEKDCSDEEHVAQNGWPKSTYRMSKIAVNGYARLLAHKLQQSSEITVNMCCPGWCATDMGSSAAPRSPAEGAKVAVWLATADSEEIGGTGNFYFENKKIQF